MSSFGIGGKLRQERQAQGLSLEDIAGPTRIAPRYLEAIEAEELELLPGLVFARNFVRQYATALKLDPEPLLAALPKLDESTVQLPVPPKTPRSRRWDSRAKSLLTSAAWLVVVAGGGLTTYHYLEHQHHFKQPASSPAHPVAAAVQAPPAAVERAQAQEAPAAQSAIASPVQVVITARQTTWVSLAADGKSSFTGTLKPNETKEISASEQVKLVTGNAGGVTVSLNGKTLDPIGSEGQVRVVRLTPEGVSLTAEGPQFPSKDPRPAADPL